MSALKDNSDERSINLFKTAANFYVERGWLTEDERHQFMSIITTEGLTQKKVAFFDLFATMTSGDNACRMVSAIRCINEFLLQNNLGNEESDNHILHMIVSDLLEESLITKEEMLEFEQEILMKSENELNMESVSGENDQRLVAAEVEDMELSAPENTNKNPMELDPVIRCLLQYLNVEEIKKCRYISKEWASVALKVLTTRSKINFKRNSKTPSKFYQVFPDTLPDIIPFSSFSISGGNEEEPWTIKQLSYFFERQGEYILELQLKDLYLVNDELDVGADGKLFNISQWLSKSPIVQPNTKRKTKLWIVNYLSRDKPQLLGLSVDLSSLKYVRHLTLCFCHVNIQDGIRISPLTFSFSSITLMKDGNKLKEFCVNDIFDFSNTIRFESGRGTTTSTVFSLDLNRNENLQLEHLWLYRKMKIINWETCKLTVKTLYLNIPFEKATGMTFKQLSTDSDVNLSLLPQTLEKLLIADFDLASQQSQPVYLQNLKFLYLSVVRNCDFLTFCQNLSVPNLTVLSLRTVRDLTVDADWIPETVKIIKLYGFRLENERNKTLNLDQLILISDKPDGHNYLNVRIKAQQLVLRLPINDEKNVSAFLELLQYYFDNSCQRIYVGKFYWTLSPLSSLDCPLRNFVDTISSKYYVFENQTGKAIAKDKFLEISDIYGFEMLDTTMLTYKKKLK